MEWYEIELDGRRTCNFPERALPGGSDNFKTQPESSKNTDTIGGIINNGEWGWMTCQTLEETTLLICSLSMGDRIAHYTFWRENQKPPGERCTIVCVAELFPGENDRRLLAVCLALDGLLGTQVAIFSPVGSQVLRYIDLDGLKSSVCTMNFVNRRVCGKTALQELDGCLVLGTESGAILLLDLNAKQTLHFSNSSSNINRPDNEVLRAEVLRGFLDEQRNWNFVRGMVRRARDLDMHLVVEVQLQCVPEAVAITSLLPIEAICGFAIGLEDGLIIIYDLKRCQVVTQLLPPVNEPPAVVESLCCVLPLDDPKPCLYICAVYNSPGSHLITSLHSIIYQKQEGGNQLKDFQAAHTRLRLLLDEVHSRVICCTTIDNGGSLLIALGWHSPEQSKNKLVLLDINQWYSEGLPHAAQKPNYLCGYVLSGLHTGLALQLDEKSVMYFQGFQHHDEHYFPNALSFDCSLLTLHGCRRYSHLGVQRRFLNSLYNQQANLLLNPQPYQQEIMRLRLMPQFCEQQVDAVFSKRGMYELIFSVALEHNRMSLLKKCAQSCLDGSFMCNMSNPTQLSLAMLTKWMVTRAEQIKDYITEMCHCIFDEEGYHLEEREQREFGQLNVQLYRLWQLQQQLMELGKGRLSVEVLEDLQHKEQAFSLLYEYQRVLYWIIDVGLLPESLQLRPLRVIKHDYQERRNKRIGRLYIDEMLQRSGLTQPLQQTAESAGAARGGAFYPPQSFRTLMQMMLFPDSLVLYKHELLLYLLLDLDSICTTTTTTRTLLFDEFALAFNVGKSLLNSVRSFWFLDRGQSERSLLELQRSPRESSHEYAEWQTRLLLEQLLTLGALQQAMQVLQHPPGYISSQLQLDVLLANDNIPEAFHHARLYEDEAGRPLLEHFFRHCISSRKFNVLGSLCLREEEEQLVYRLLRQCKTRKADCVQLILLLKRCKYIEAVSFMDEVAAERSQGGIDSDDPSTILSAYRHTMAPVNQSIAGKYFRIRNNLNGAQLRNMAPEPFSCQLAKQSANGMLGGIFQSSALSAHWATRYAHEPRMLQGPNMPFLRNAAAQGAGSILSSSQRRIVRPTPYQHAEKRALERERELEEGREVSLSKRRRLLPGGEQFTQDVGNFVQRMQQLKQAERERQLELERQQEQQRDQEQVLALIKPPEYLQRGEMERTGAGAGAEVVPPAILRRRASAAETGQRRSRYSFMAPIPLGGCRQEEEQEEEQQQQEAEQEQMELDKEHQKHADEQQQRQQQNESEQESQQEEEEEETDEIIVEFQQENSSQTEGDSNTDEEYMSPLASANTSMMEMAPPTGPQPRNSLQQQASSGFGSFASSIQSGSTRGSLFVPPVCSSKMHIQEVQQQQSVVRISERTTVCGDLNESSLAATASSSLWPMPSVSLGTPRQPLQGLDTTLGMSSYDVTEAGAGTAAAVAQVPTEYIELDEDEEHGHEQEREQQQERRHRRRSSCSDSDENEDEPVVGMDYQPSSYSVSSELSDSGSPAAQDAPVYSIVVESTTSITTSRSPTSHTPTSFLPSDTNVSLNSSPRAAGTAGDGGGGGAGGAIANAADGSNRSIYRANSLETVDDLDTTKGSLEEDEDVDMLDEDECVIALDGTEVRGYVARPEPVPGACSSAELFSFKKDEADEGTAEHLPCPSLGATLGGNSDSAMGYTINLDSIESADNESVATVHKQQEAEQEQQQQGEEKQQEQQHQASREDNAARPVQVEDVIETIEESASDQVILVESDCELVDTTAHESDVEIVEQSVYSDADSRNSLVLTVSDNEEEVVEVREGGNKSRQEQQQRQEEIKQQEEKRLQEAQRQLEEKQRQEKLHQEEQWLQNKRMQEEKERLEEEEKERLIEEQQRLEEEEKGLEKEKRLEEEETKRLQEEEKLRLQEEEKLRLEQEKHRLEEKLQKKEAEEAQVGEEMQVDMSKELQGNEQEIEMEIDEELKDQEEEQPKQAQQKQRKQKKPAEVEEQPVASSKPPMVRVLRTRHNAASRSSPVPVRPPSAIGLESPASSPAPSPSTSPVFQLRRRLRSSDRQQSASPATLDRGTPSPATVSAATGRRAQRQRRLRSDDSVASVDSQAELAKRVLRAGSMPAMSTVPVSTPKRRTRLLPKPLEVIQETGEASLMPRTRSRTQLNQSIVDADVDTPKRKLRSTSEPPREAAVTTSTAVTPKPTKPKRTRKSSVASSVASTDGLPTEDSPQPRVLRSRRSTVEEPQASPAPSPPPEVSHANETNVPPKKRGRSRK